MKEQEKISSFSRLAKFAEPYKGKYIASVILATLGVTCNMAPYFVVFQIVIQLIEGGQNLTFYLQWCIVALVAFLFREIFHNISTILSHQATFAVISEVRRQIATKLTKVPMGYILDTPSGKIKSTMVEKVDSIEPSLAHALPEMTSNILIPFAIIIYLFVLDWRMAMISLVTLPIGIGCYMLMMKDYEVKYGGYVAVGKHMDATAVEYINGIEVIKAFGQSATSYEKFADAVKANASYGLDWMKQVQLYFAMALGIWPAVLIGTLPLGCIFYMNGTLDAATFITIIILSLGIVGPLLAAMYYSDDIGEILDEEEQIRPTSYAKLNGTDIILKDVTFGYNDTQILNGINLKIPTGSVTALVGPSGGGKSTIAKLIASFWDVTGGIISIGDVDIKDIKPEQLMENTAYVAQDNYLFDTTVMENIRMGKHSINDEEIICAAKSTKQKDCHFK